jgi:hypothetical protein
MPKPQLIAHVAITITMTKNKLKMWDLDKGVD